MEHPDQTPAFTLAVKPLSVDTCGHTVFGKMHINGFYWKDCVFVVVVYLCIGKKHAIILLGGLGSTSMIPEIS